MKSFLVGLGVGVGLGLLFAPMSGEETRVNLADRASDLANSARETYEENRDRVQRGVESIRGTAERAVGQTRDTVKQTVKQAVRATGTEGTIPGTSNL
jgi:gas vesicle protein